MFFSQSQGACGQRRISGSLLSESVSNSTLHTTELLDHGELQLHNLRRLWKKVASISVEGLRKTTKTINQVANIPTEIRTRHFLNTQQTCYHLIQDGSNMTGTDLCVNKLHCTADAQCGLFTHKSVPVIFEPPCTLNIVGRVKIRAGTAMYVCL